MGDKIIPNECKKFLQDDSEENLDNSETFSLLHTDEFESFQSGFQPIDNKAMLGYTSQNTSYIDNDTIEDNFSEPQEFDTSRCHSFFQYQNQSHGEQSKLHLKCSYSNEENRELQQKRDQEDSISISVVGRCIRTACDVLLGIDHENNGVFSETIDSHYKEIFQTEPNFFYSKEETLSRKDELLHKNEANRIDKQESKFENADSSNKQLEHDSSVEILKSSHSQSQVEISRFERTFVCEIGMKRLNTLSLLLTHNCPDSPEKHFQHRLHQKHFYEMGHFSQQKLTKDRSFQCTVCDKVFLENDRDRHMNTHPGEKSILCDICKRTFNDTSKLTRHMLTHSGKKIHQCNLCEKTFSKKYNLDTHKRTHTREKPFHCVVCEQRFSQGASLNRHMRTHTGEKPFQCNLCDQTFSEKCVLDRHKRIHSGEKPFQCAVCDDRFSLKSSLNRHMRKHTGPKPF
ncbi:hypothetical protein TNIN_300691 [Trichonephila inaurata madagascariensis]|uniref:C2H2-type domain-containing protein n=1 Tax=Trichonephila inaurata madagascariensis TaxID=2747483 RepID=A0A8X6WQA4_9ARAC|nr:hypothetical protein TNIN_300691 [Trichonephila inaurata madagascariensis]